MVLSYTDMRSATGPILEDIRPLLTLPYRRRIRFKGERLLKELTKHGFSRCRGKLAWRKYFGENVSVHIICYDHGCFYHVDNH